MYENIFLYHMNVIWKYLKVEKVKLHAVVGLSKENGLRGEGAKKIKNNK